MDSECLRDIYRHACLHQKQQALLGFFQRKIWQPKHLILISLHVSPDIKAAERERGGPDVSSLLAITAVRFILFSTWVTLLASVTSLVDACVNQMFDHLYPHHCFIPCASQTVVVMHPAVSVFVTRGGTGSFYEGLYANKRLAVFPFFGDQFPNAYNVEHKGIGVYLNYELNQEQMNEKITLDCRDSDENYQKNVNRYKALIQVHSQDDCIRAADLVEEVSFVNK